jgi:hypothetical protein
MPALRHTIGTYLKAKDQLTPLLALRDALAKASS